MIEQIDHLSHSSLTAADECLKKYYVTRLAEEKIPDMPADARDIGILVHVYIEAYFKGESQLTKLAEQAHTWHHEEALQIFAKWKIRFSIPEDRWLYTERYGSIQVFADVPKIIGYDDFVYYDENGTHVIRDFKTGYSSDVSPSYLFQLDLAMLRYEDEFPGVEVEAEIEFVRSGIISPRRKWNAERRQQTLDRIRVIWQRLSTAKEWTETPGSHCTFCPVKASCAASMKVQKEGLVIVDEDSARLMLTRIALMEEAIKAQKEALKSYVDLHGMIQAGEGKYDYVAKYNSSTSIYVEDPKKVVEIVGLENMGKVLKIDLKVKDGQKLIDDERLAGVIKKGKVSQRFYIGKNKGEEEDA